MKKIRSLNELDQLKMLTESLAVLEGGWDAKFTMQLIARAIELSGYDLSPEQVLNDFKQKSPQHIDKIPDMDADRWMQHIEWTYDAPAPKGLAGKIYKAGTDYLNCEVYVDDAQDWIEQQYGEDAAGLSVEEIGKILKKGDWCHTGRL